MHIFSTDLWRDDIANMLENPNASLALTSIRSMAIRSLTFISNALTY